MVIIADKKIPDEALYRLKPYEKIILIETKDITYSAISGHPDIFFCQADDVLIISSNLPVPVIDELKTEQIRFVFAENKTGNTYPATAGLNAGVTPDFIIHNENYTDPVLKRLCSAKQFVHVNQGYTRCNLIPLKNNRFITSDKGIEKALKKHNLEVLYVDPKGILLPGFDHGFIGGTCGVFDDNIFFTGSLNRFPEGEKVRDFLDDHNIIEVYDGPLFDGGSLIFV
ncbi:MAG TPA: hypothetical protein ENH02_07830 [Bacteroidetes bacterium]|nr:hypothetical protein [Bacteroidota bacterium]